MGCWLQEAMRRKAQEIEKQRIERKTAGASVSSQSFAYAASNMGMANQGAVASSGPQLGFGGGMQQAPPPAARAGPGAPSKGKAELLGGGGFGHPFRQRERGRRGLWSSRGVHRPPALETEAEIRCSNVQKEVGGSLWGVVSGGTPRRAALAAPLPTGMQLGKSKKTNALVESLRAEGEMVETLTPASIGAPAAAAAPTRPVSNDPVFISVEEKVSRGGCLAAAPAATPAHASACGAVTAGL